MATYSENDFKRIAAAMGKDLVLVLRYEKRFEAAAMWFRLNREGPKTKRTAPSAIEKRMNQIANTARRLLWHLEVFNYRNAADGPGISPYWKLSLPQRMGMRTRSCKQQLKSDD